MMQNVLWFDPESNDHIDPICPLANLVILNLFFTCITLGSYCRAALQLRASIPSRLQTEALSTEQVSSRWRARVSTMLSPSMDLCGGCQSIIVYERVSSTLHPMHPAETRNCYTCKQYTFGSWPSELGLCAIPECKDLSSG